MPVEQIMWVLAIHWEKVFRVFKVAVPLGYVLHILGPATIQELAVVKLGNINMATSGMILLKFMLHVPHINAVQTFSPLDRQTLRNLGGNN